QRRVDAREEALDLARVQTLQQRVLGAEAPEQRHAADPRARRDVVHGGGAVGNRLERRVEDPRLHRVHLPMILRSSCGYHRVMAGVFPDREEALRLAVGPESITWRRAGDMRTMFGAGAALLLQVAHPTVAAGVLESLADPKAPDVRGLGPRTWKAVTLPTSHTMRLATIGLLSQTARRALGLEWTRAMELELDTVGRLSRSTTPILPRRLRIV